MAKRQLRELQRLVAWSWDSRVDEHPPGEKAMHDFENVIKGELDNRRRPRAATTPSSVAKEGGAATDSPALLASGGWSGAKPAQRGSADRGIKRALPAVGSEEGKAGARRGAKLPRLEPSPGAKEPTEAFEQQQQEQPGHLSTSEQPAAAVPALFLPAASPALERTVQATPFVRQQPQLRDGQSPAVPLPGSAVTPAAALLAGVAQTPAAAFSFPSSLPSAGPSTAGAGRTTAALADGHCVPTPAPTPMPVPDALAAGPSGDAAAAVAAAPEFKQPAPRFVLTSQKGKPSEQQAEQQADAATAASLAVAPAAAAAEAEAEATSGAAPMETDEVPAAAAAAAAADTDAPAVVATPAAAAVPSAAAPVTEVPTPVIQAFAAADQLVYHRPRPSSCPPLFKQPSALVSGGAALRGSRSAGKSPLGKQRSPGSFTPAGVSNKENVESNGDPAAAGLTPRTAEPAAPQAVALSGWKQRQLQQLSAGFHTRQRRLLELLSACNRVQQLQQQQEAAVPAGGMVAGALPQQATAGGKAAQRGAAAAKPPLGPRAAAMAASSAWAAGEGRQGGGRGGMGRALGRLKEQQAA